MPFLHLDSLNLHKEDWIELVKDHPAGFEILEWTTEQERDHLHLSYPELDTRLYPRYCISVAASLRKLLDYGGIVVRGEDVSPIRGLRIILNDWRTLGQPKSLTVRGFGYPIYIDKSTIMTCESGDSTCARYCEKIIEQMLRGEWENPTFGDDVGIM